jgi:LPS sulfotransferase NodH
MRVLLPRTGLRGLDEATARAAIRVRSLAGNRTYRRFVIVGIARTGSTLLLSLLNAHRQVLAFGEVFRGDGRIGWDITPFLSYQSPRLLRQSDEAPADFLDREVFRRWPREVGAVGFKLFYYHARSGPKAAVWDMIRDDPEIAIIHIKRENILAQYLSLTLAHRTNVWSSSGPPADGPGPIRLDPQACIQHFRQVRHYENECDTFFAGREVEQVSYEELVADKAAVMDRIWARLGVPALPVRERTARQQTLPLTEAIANSAELQDAFAGTEWSAFLTENGTPARGETA